MATLAAAARELLVAIAGIGPCLSTWRAIMSRYSFGIPPTASLILASAFWAVATVISKKLLASVPPITFLIIQLAPSVSVLWILVLAKGVRPVKWRALLPLAALGWLNTGLSYTLCMLGLARTTASVATLLWAAEPALIVGMAWLVLREPLTGRLVALTATAACGVLLVSGAVVDDGSVAGDEYGTALILGGVLCCALYTLLSRGIAVAADGAVRWCSVGATEVMATSELRFAAYVEGLVEVIGHADRAVPLQDYCLGLLMPGERKSVEPMAAVTAPARVPAQHQSLLHFVGNAAWSDEAVLAKVRALVLPAVARSGPIEAWIIDDTGFPKKGRHSVGVTRQYCGQLGKQDNCQVAVTLSIANHAASLPIAYRLYLPLEWAADAARQTRAGVPEATGFASKPDIALDQIRAAPAAG